MVIHVEIDKKNYKWIEFHQIKFSDRVSLVNHFALTVEP